MRLYLIPHLGSIAMAGFDTSAVRRWHGQVSAGTQSPVTTAKAYRLLRQIIEAAVDDKLLRSYPCTLKNVAVERSAERSTPTIDGAVRLADVTKPEYRLMVLLAAVAGLRRGECFALRRRDLAEVGGVWSVNVNASVVFVKDVAIHQAPKTTAGVRRFTLPSVIVPAIVNHLDLYGLFKPDQLLFVDQRTGTTPTMTVWRRVWSNARRDAEVDYTFHRPLAGTLNTTAGASIRESTARMGHSSPRVALRYQHLVELRDAEVASSIDRLFE